MLFLLAACTDPALTSRVEALEKRQSELETEVAALKARVGPVVVPDVPPAPLADPAPVQVDAQAALAFLAHPERDDVKAIPARGPDGAVGGYRVMGIRPGSTAEAMGLRNGDTIRALDGAPLSSPEAPDAAIAAARTAGSFALDVIRQGQPITVRVTLR